MLTALSSASKDCDNMHGGCASGVSPVGVTTIISLTQPDDAFEDNEQHQKIDAATSFSRLVFVLSRPTSL